MAVVKMKDGRWTVQGRKGFFGPGEASRTRKYFGRGSDAEKEARLFDHGLKVSRRKYRVVPGSDLQSVISDMKSEVASEVHKIVSESIMSQEKRNRNKNGSKPKANERDIVKDILYKMASSKPNYPVHVEVRTPNGYIDIMTPRQIIEVKPIHLWKQAIGQINAYGAYFPDHHKKIHLFANSKTVGINSAMETIRKECRRNEVLVELQVV